MAKVAIVTGANKGIGFAIVRNLCKNFGGDVYLTSRDETRGKEAVGKLQKEGLKPLYHQLDVEDSASIERLKTFLQEKYGGIDVLINNAGYLYELNSVEKADVTMSINFWGLLNVSNALFPLLKSNSRVVHISSSLSTIGLANCSPAKRKELLSCKTVNDVCEQMKAFVCDVQSGVHKEKGWANAAYSVSKIGVTLLCSIQQRLIDEDKSRNGILINGCCPGYVATDMTKYMGPKTVDEGADTPTYLALLDLGTESPKGAFVMERQITPVDEESAIALAKNWS